MTNKKMDTIAVSIVTAALVLGFSFYQTKKPHSTLRSVGSATQRITSDKVKWNLVIGRMSALNNLAQAHNLLQKDYQTTVNFLSSKGISPELVIAQPASSMPNYGQNGIKDYQLEQRITISSDDIAKVEAVALNLRALYEKGIQVKSSNIDYLYSKLEDLKIELLKEATANSQKRAGEIAKSVGGKVGKIVSANSGVFQIREPDSQDISDYGVYNTSSKIKDVYVTVTATFEIK